MNIIVSFGLAPARWLRGRTPQLLQTLLKDKKTHKVFYLTLIEPQGAHAMSVNHQRHEFLLAPSPFLPIPPFPRAPE